MLTSYGDQTCTLTLIFANSEELEIYSCLGMLAIPQCIGYPDFTVRHGKDFTTIVVIGVDKEGAELLELEINRYSALFRERGITSIDNVKRMYGVSFEEESE